MNLSSTPPSIDLLSSGLSPVDRAWGGLQRGAAYLVYGSAQSGRHLAMLSISKAGFEQSERSVIVTTRDPAALSAEASALGLDLSDAYNRGLVRLMRLPANALAGRDDAGLRKVFEDLVALAVEHGPDRLIVDDFTPLVPFRTFEAFQSAFESLMADMRGVGSAVVLGMGEPANEQSKRIVDTMRRLVHGSIHVARVESRSVRQLRLESAGHVVEGNWDPTGMGPRLAPPEVSEDGSYNGDGSSSRGGAEPSYVTQPRPASDFGTDTTEPAAEQETVVTYITDEDDSPETDAFGFETAPDFEQPEVLRNAGRVPEAAALPEPETPNFYSALAQAFSTHREDHNPFLVLALKATSSRAAGLMGGIEQAVMASAPPEALLEPIAGATLLVLIPGAHPEAAQPIISALRTHVKSNAGDQTADILRAIGTLIIPNGQPFTDADELLAHLVDN